MPPTPAQLAQTLKPVLATCSGAEVWGEPLFAPGSPVVYQVEVSALFAGLKLHLRPATGGARTLLKIAQPRELTVTPGRIEIGKAAYISWGGRKFKEPAGRSATPALVLF